MHRRDCCLNSKLDLLQAIELLNEGETRRTARSYVQSVAFMFIRWYSRWAMVDGLIVLRNLMNFSGVVMTYAAPVPGRAMDAS